MESRTYLVARVGLAELWLWDPEHGASHSGVSEYQDVLVMVFEGAPSAAEVRRAVDDIRLDALEADDHAELHSHALMDEGTWRRFSSPQRGTPDLIHGTGLQAVIHFHHSLDEALDAGSEAGATFKGEGTAEPTLGNGDAEGSG